MKPYVPSKIHLSWCFSGSKSSPSRRNDSPGRRRPAAAAAAERATCWMCLSTERKRIKTNTCSHRDTCPSCFLLALLQTEDCLVLMCKTPGMRNWIVKLINHMIRSLVASSECGWTWDSLTVLFCFLHTFIKPFLISTIVIVWLCLDFLPKRQSEMWTLYSHGIIWWVYFTWCPNNEQWSLVVWKKTPGWTLVFELHECLAPQTLGQVCKWIMIQEIPGIYVCMEVAVFQLWKIVEVSVGAFFISVMARQEVWLWHSWLPEKEKM